MNPSIPRSSAERYALRNITKAINRELQDLTSLTDLILKPACEFIGATHGSLVLVDWKTKSLHIAAVLGEDWTPEKQKCSLKLGEGITGKVAATGLVYLCRDTRLDPTYYPLFPNVICELAVPVISKGKVLGLINLDSDKPDAFSPRDIRFLEELAEHAGIALDNARQIQSLKAAREEWQEIFSAMPDGIVVCDPDLSIVHANEGFQKMFGISAAQLRCHTLPSLFQHLQVEDTQGELWLKLRQLGTLEQRIWSKSQSRSFFIRNTKSRIQGSTVYIFSVRETTREDRLQKQVHQAEKLATLGQMVAAVAHELNNPLQTVAGFSELLLHHPDWPKVAEQLSLINHEAQRAARLVKSLLVFSRSQPPEFRRWSAQDLIQKIVNTWSKIYLSSRIQLKFREECSDCSVDVDYSQIEQVVINLLNNAQQALLSASQVLIGEIIVSVSRSSGKVVFTVADNGPGITEENRDKIFDPFFTTKKLGKGTGLGLSICKGIIEKHGGSISCETNPARGCRFSFLVPESSLPLPEVVRPAPRQNTSWRALVVDDEPGICYLLESILKVQKIGCTICSNGHDALDLLVNNDYDLILSDLNMPEIGGHDFLLRINQIKPHLMRRIILISGDNLVEGKDLQVDSFIPEIIHKPFQMDQLVRKIKDKMEFEANFPATSQGLRAG